MKKTLIAAAALAVSAGAMAEVTITGVFDTTLRASTYDSGVSGSDAVTTTKIGRDGAGTSGLYFNAKEDLGDGLVALGFLELDASPFEAATVWNGGEKYAGLQGGFGSIKIGSPNTPSLAAQGIRAGMFGTKDGGRGVAGGGTATNNEGAASFIANGTLMGISLTRFNGTVRYDTPSFSGFSVALNYLPESDNSKLTANSGSEYKTGDAIPVQGAVADVGLLYKAGPINAALTIYSKDEDRGTSGATLGTTSAKQTQTSFGLQYNAGFAIFGAGLNQTKYEGGANDIDIAMSGWNVLATVPLSEALSLGFNFQTLTVDDDAAADKVKYTQFAAGVNYSLSKLTSVYARFVSAANDADTGSQKDATAATTLIGLMTKF